MTADEPSLDVAHLVEVGKLTVQTAQIEYHLVGITAALVSPENTEIGMTVVGKQHFGVLASLAKRTLPARLGPTSPAADLAQPITAWISAAEEVMNRRNQLLHAIWMINAPRQTATVLRRNGETEDLPIERLRRDVAYAEPVAWQGGDLWQELSARFGHFGALIEATKAMDPDWWAEQEAQDTQ